MSKESILEEFDKKFIGNITTPTYHQIIVDQRTLAQDIEINGNRVKQFLSKALDQHGEEKYQEGFREGYKLRGEYASDDMEAYKSSPEFKKLLEEKFQRGIDLGLKRFVKADKEMVKEAISSYRQELIEKIEKFGEDLELSNNPFWVLNKIIEIIKLIKE